MIGLCLSLFDDLLSACPKKVLADRVLCDPFLLMEIAEMRSLNEQRARTDEIEDFTQLEDN